MRPRQITAENVVPAFVEGGITLASMRPRQITAENEDLEKLERALLELQ